MDHTGASNISYCVVILQKGLSRKNHILIENRPADKAALKPEFLPVIGAAHIGGKKGLDSHLLQICPCLYAAFLRVIKASCIPFCQRAVLIRKLSRIGHDHSLSLGPSLFKGLHQRLDQMFICRNRIIGHKYHNICTAEAHSSVSGLSVVKFLFCQMVDLQVFNPFKPMLIPKGFFRIHHDDLSHRPGLALQHFQKP